MPNEVKLLPCPTCGADYANENPFCSDGFHAKGPLYWPCEHCGGTGNAHSRPTTLVTDEVVESVKASLEDVFYDTLDCAFDADLLARAALASMPTVVTGER